MNTKRFVSSLAVIGIMATALPGFGSPAFAAQAQGFADPAFQSTWNRTDSLVANGTVRRSWYWGPQPNTQAIMEDYDQGPGGKHLVQYFDKSRMEINNPEGDKNNPFYVTNGLLAKELITGYIQVGDDRFILRWPAEIAIAGDTNVNKGTTITYSSFRGAIDRKDSNSVGKIVNAMISWTGSLDFEHGGPGYMNYDRFNVKNVYYESVTQHNIPDVFWRFLIANGPVVENGRVVNRQINDPYFYATGLPISDAYWSSVVINGQPRTVLVQAYERRVLTYVPDNPEGFKVEMGNVGLHYYDWRYKDAGKPDALTGSCQQNPTLGFGNLYNNNTLVKIQLGCAAAGEARSTVAYQPFQHGSMLATTRFDFYSGWTYEDIFVLFDDGTVKTFPFIHNDQIWDLSDKNPGPGPTPVPTPPAGLFAPERNFTTVWLSTSGVNMRERLGWALASPQVAHSVKDSQGTVLPAAGGVIQLFQGGIMVYPNVPALNKKIVVLYNTSGYAYIVAGPHNTYINADHYNVYDDTFQPR